MMNDEKIQSVFETIKPLESYYPNIKDWFFGKVIEGMKDSSRNILLAERSNKIVGVCILRIPIPKICTLFIASEYHHIGIGSILLEEAFEILNTNSPRMSIPKDHYGEFSPIFAKYNFELSKALRGEYTHGKFEYYFNYH